MSIAKNMALSQESVKPHLQVNVPVQNIVSIRSRSTGTSYSVLVTLCRWADHRGFCCPAVATIAQWSHLSVRSVQTALQKLIAAGELKLDTNATKFRTRRYRLTPGGTEFDLSAKVQTPHPVGVQNTHPVGAKPNACTVATSAPERKTTGFLDTDLSSPSVSCSSHVSKKQSLSDAADLSKTTSIAAAAARDRTSKNPEKGNPNFGPESLLSAYQEARGDLPEVHGIDSDRRRRCLELLQSGPPHEIVSKFRAAVSRAARSPYLQQHISSGWLGFDWLLRKYLLVLEGKYDQVWRKDERQANSFLASRKNGENLRSGLQP